MHFNPYRKRDIVQSWSLALYIKKKNIEELEVMDRSLLRYITGAYVKTQNWFLYLETGVLNIYFKKTNNCRLMNFQTVLKKDVDEITIKYLYLPKGQASERRLGGTLIKRL